MSDTWFPEEASKNTYGIWIGRDFTIYDNLSNNWFYNPMNPTDNYAQ